MTEGPRTLRNYPDYAPSEVPWLDEVPSHWKVCPLRRVLVKSSDSIKIGPFGSQLKLEVMTASGFKVYGQEHVISSDFSRGAKYVDAEKFAELKPCEVRPGDLLVTMMGSSGRCAVVPANIEQGIMDSHLLRVRLPGGELNPNFVALAIAESSHIRSQVVATGKGAIMHGLNSGIVKSLVFTIPPLSEQHAILSFLDRETSKIDALVAKKERLIELLQEKRTALITHAVTKGLDPNAPMKPSGIDWLGDIPAHWELRKMAYLANMQSGSTPSKTNISYWRGDIPWVSPKDMKTRTISDSIDHVSDAALAETGLQLLAPPLVLIVVRGMILAHSFPVALSDAPLTINQDMKALRLASGLDHNFFVYCLEGLKELVLSLVAEAGHGTKRLRTDLWRAIKLYLPRLDEQRSISRALDTETARLDLLIRRVGDGVKRLQEYRTALISAAVTGKIDVREEVA